MCTKSGKVKKLYNKAKNCGIRELCELLGTFAESQLENLSNDELDEFEILLNYPDWEIFDMLSEMQNPPKQISTVVSLIRTWIFTTYRK